MKNTKNRSDYDGYIVGDKHYYIEYDKDGNIIREIMGDYPEDFGIEVKKNEPKPSLWQRIKNFINYWK